MKTKILITTLLLITLTGCNKQPEQAAASEPHNAAVAAKLAALEAACKDESVNLMPVILEAVKAYATLGEVCGVMRKVFGEYQPTVSL